MKIKTFVAFLDQTYPKEIFDDIDIGKLGLQIGNLEDDLHHVMMTLDLSLEVAKEAVEKKCNFIISHHPVVFYPMLSFVEQTQNAQLLRFLIRHQINVYNMHTNLDIAIGGVNDALATLFGLEEVSIIKTEFPNQDFMRYGSIKPQTLEAFASHIKQICNIPLIKIIGNPKKVIKKVGLIGGAGSEIKEQNRAVALGCDVYITSEIKHHEALHANLAPLAMIEIPHSAEFHYTTLLQPVIREFLPSQINIVRTTIPQDPFLYV
jgi:dinuclear metal center YbgI/SA1388 family protein